MYLIVNAPMNEVGQLLPHENAGHVKCTLTRVVSDYKHTRLPS